MSTVRTALSEAGTKGEFLRTDSTWRNWISREPGAKFPPAKNRYHLFVAYACPWAHRTLMVRALKGLEDVIPVTVVHPTWQRTKPDDPDDTHTGWIFGSDGSKNPNNKEDDTTTTTITNSIGLGGPFSLYLDGLSPDPIFGSKSIREFYERANDQNGKYSVPILWDTIHHTIVNNESSDIIRMFNSEFNDLCRHPELDLYPLELRSDIDAANDWIYPTINNGVYRCGFAKSQEAYDIAIDELTQSLDRITLLLQHQRYIVGNRFTEADVRLFVTLLRFDEVYVVYFKTNTRSVLHSNNDVLLNYCRDIYQMNGIATTVNMKHIKMHYYTSHPDLNRWSIIPRGQQDVEDQLKQPHNRHTMH